MDDTPDETPSERSVDMRRRAEQRVRASSSHQPPSGSRAELEAAWWEARVRQEELALENESLRGLDRDYRHQSELFQKLLDSVPVMVVIYDPRLRHFQLNRQVTETLGWTERDIRERDLMEEVYPDPELRAEVQRFMKDLEPGWRDFPSRAKDGTIVDTSWANVGLTDQTRIGIGVDVRERKQRESQLTQLNAQLAEHVARRSGELQHSIVQLEVESARREQVEQTLQDRSRLLEAFFEYSMSPLMFLDRHLRVLRVNQAFSSAMQRSPEDVLGREYTSLGLDQPDRQMLDDALRTGRAIRRTAQRFRRPRHADGGRTYWNWALVPLREGGGEVSELVLAFEDVTEETRSREELEAANAELNRLADQLRSLTMQLAETEDRERRRLAEVLHDELQQLLTGARYQLGALVSRFAPAGDARAAVERIEGLIEESASKARTLSHELRPTVLEHSHLGPALEWLVEDFERRHGLRVSLHLGQPRGTELPPGLKLFVFNAVRELLFNVVKHAGRSEAELHLRSRDGELQIDVVDQGDGFDIGRLDSPGSEGVGFGLFGIRERVQLLGGRLAIDSLSGRGTRARLVVPLTHAQEGRAGMVGLVPGEPQGAPGPPEELAGSEVSLRVLVVDDHPEARAGVIALASQIPSLHVAGEAEDGQQAIDMARQLQPDVVLMDVAMPVVDGISATRAIKTELPMVKVIGLSAYDSAELRQRMVEAGAESCLSKNEAPDQLLEAIRRAVPSGKDSDTEI